MSFPEFTPEDTSPDPDFLVVGRNARLAAHYHRTLKESGLCEFEAIELTKQWVTESFDFDTEEPG
jgi:hypothetical protein